MVKNYEPDSRQMSFAISGTAKRIIPCSKHSAGLPTSRNPIAGDCYSHLYVYARILLVLLETQKHIYNPAQNILRGTPGTEEWNSGTYGLKNDIIVSALDIMEPPIVNMALEQLASFTCKQITTWVTKRGKFLNFANVGEQGLRLSGLLLPKLEKVRQRYVL